MTEETQRKMLRLAQATNTPCYIGVRPSGNWFARCGDIEFDGSTPDNAVTSVRDAWIQSAKDKRRDADTALRTWERIETELKA